MGRVYFYNDSSSNLSTITRKWFDISCYMDIVFKTKTDYHSRMYRETADHSVLPKWRVWFENEAQGVVLINECGSRILHLYFENEDDALRFKLEHVDDERIESMQAKLIKSGS